MSLGPRTALDRLIVQIAAAINTRALYTEGHPRVGLAVHAVLDALTAAAAERRQQEVTFLIVGDDLVVDQKPMRSAGLFQQNFVQTLRRRGVERLTVARGLCLVSGGPLASPEERVAMLVERSAAEGGPAGVAEWLFEATLGRAPRPAVSVPCCCCRPFRPSWYFYD